jgi:protein-L-isoaspartate O-methyltransferase
LKYTKSNPTVLDLGCGSGFPLATALKLGYDAWGIEIVPGLAEQARVNLTNLGLDSSRVIDGDFTKSAFYHFVNK